MVLLVSNRMPVLPAAMNLGSKMWLLTVATLMYSAILDVAEASQTQLMSQTKATVTPLRRSTLVDDVKASFDPLKLVGNQDEANKRAVIVWPTIPVSVKGSDSRPLDAVKYLSQAGFEVDLIFWQDFASEIRDVTYDDRQDRQRLRQAGAKQILGPYDETKFSKSGSDVSLYDIVLFWLWPNWEFLDGLIDIVEHVKKTNGQARAIAALDDDGMASRLLKGSVKNKDISFEDVQAYVLAKRPSDIVGNLPDLQQSMQAADFDEEAHEYATVLIHQEVSLYTMSDILVGISEPVVKFLEEMVPGKPVHKLSYVSPVSYRGSEALPKKAFNDRSDYLFFGYENFANNEALNWFVQQVLPKMDPAHKLHVAGHVTTEMCTCSSSSVVQCQSKHPNIVCHGAVTDEHLDKLIRSSRAVINPTLEPSGVSTKTCRAMAYGTPVVVTDQDGTFTDERMSQGAIRCRKGDADAQCFIDALNGFLNEEAKWNPASKAASKFITENYGSEVYAQDWLSILKLLSTKKIEVVIEGNAIRNGESLASQNWHIAHTLNRISDFRVTVLGGELEPTINGVLHAQSSTPPGYQADFVIRQNWPHNFDALPRALCGPGCRVAHILPWEFGSLPKAWMPLLDKNVDSIWAPSEYTRKIYENSGYTASRSSVVPAGIDCGELLHARHVVATAKKTKPVTFIFSGGFLPRKGVDILLEEWENVFCSDPFARLILHTSYEHGFFEDEKEDMENIVNKCKNIEWKRGEWMEREKYAAMLEDSDIYVAPFRSEGFGLPVLESAILGKRTIVSMGGTSADDFLRKDNPSHTLYPVKVVEEKCRHFPCAGDNLCVFQDKCEKLVHQPTWFEVNRKDLRRQMRQAYKDVISNRSSKAVHDAQVSESESSAMSYCWSNLAEEYHAQILSSIELPIQRSLPEVSRNNHFVMAGMVRDAAAISVQNQEFITKISCLHKVRVHIVAAVGLAELHENINILRAEMYPNQECAPLHLLQEPNSQLATENRVDRIKRLRDFQRTSIESLLPGYDLGGHVVILADLDLLALPSVEQVMREAEKMRNGGEVDVLCSAGVEENSAFGYYDTFATVLLPDTFVYPIDIRSTEASWPEEDQTMIIGDGWTSEDLMHWFEESGASASGAVPVPVRSCFGGLALYRAERWLDSRCGYAQETAENKKYANKEDGLPCEHVVLHNCLRAIDPDVTVAVQPDMQTVWHSDLVYLSRGLQNATNATGGADTLFHEGVGEYEEAEETKRGFAGAEQTLSGGSMNSFWSGALKFAVAAASVIISAW